MCSSPSSPNNSTVLSPARVRINCYFQKGFLNSLEMVVRRGVSEVVEKSTIDLKALEVKDFQSVVTPSVVTICSKRLV